MSDKDEALKLVDRITSYLSNGGLFNPEMMDHKKVSDLLIDCRAALTAAIGVGGQAVTKPEGYLFDLRYGEDRWSHQRMFSDCLPSNPDDVRNVVPLYAHPSPAIPVEEVERVLEPFADYVRDNALVPLHEEYVAAAALLSRLRAGPQPATVSPSDPSMILAGIKQFGLAGDGSDLRDLEAAIERLRAGPQEAGRAALASTDGRSGE